MLLAVGAAALRGEPARFGEAVESDQRRGSFAAAQDDSGFVVNGRLVCAVLALPGAGTAPRAGEALLGAVVVEPDVGRGEAVAEMAARLAGP